MFIQPRSAMYLVASLSVKALSFSKKSAALLNIISPLVTPSDSIVSVALPKGELNLYPVLDRLSKPVIPLKKDMGSGALPIFAL